MTPDQHKHLLDHFDKSGYRLENQAMDSPLPPATPFADDPETSREWEVYKLALAAIYDNAITEEVKKIRKESEAAPVIPLTPKAPAVSIVRRLTANSMKIAAAFFILICVGKYLFTSSSSVAQKYESSYELSSTRSGNAADAVAQAYQSKNWPAVVTAFQAASVKTGKDYFLTGMALREQKKYDQAIVLFNTLLANDRQSKDPWFQDEAEYYAALTYLAMDQPSQALPLLDKIKADPDHLYYQQVKRMSGLDKLILRVK